MSTAATTTGVVDLAQLAREVGSAEALAPLSAITTGTPGEADYSCVVECYDPDVTDAQLQAAVDAHVPAPPPPTQSEVTQHQLDDLLDLLIDSEVI